MRQLLLVLLFVLVGYFNGTAQERQLPGVEKLFPKEHFSKTQWKSLSDMQGFILHKQSQLDDILREPSVQPEDRALYLCQKSMLDHLEALLTTGEDPWEAISKSYERVNFEYLLNPETKELPTSAFPSILNELFENLQALPDAQKFNID